MRTIGALALVLLIVQAAPAAHEVPNEVTVLTFLRPEGTHLRFLVRAPLKSLRDVDVPTKGQGMLDLDRIEPTLLDASMLWIGDFVKVYENGQELPKPTVVAARVSLPSDRSFATYEQAMAHLAGDALPSDTELYWEQGLLDVLFEFPIASDRADFAIIPGLTRLGLRVNVVMRYQMPGGVERAFDVHGDSGLVHLDPRWYQAVVRFILDGFWHILDGTDHLLFLLCLVIPFRRMRPLLVVITAFTVAHSVTLIASAFGLAPSGLWFPPLVEVLIAISIVYMAFENIVGAHLERRWVMTFAFGLVHGFGFSFVLSERLQFAGSHLLTSLLAFNVGVELGQLLVLTVAIPALALLFRYVVEARVGTTLLSALVAHTAWHWMTDRWEALRRFPIPEMDAAAWAGLLRWMMAMIATGVALWLISGVVSRWEGLGERASGMGRPGSEVGNGESSAS
jgi:hypothetical protein